MPAAMRPEKPVARIWAQYRTAMRAATSAEGGQYCCSTYTNDRAFMNGQICALEAQEHEKKKKFGRGPTFTSVKDGQHISRTRVKRRLSDTEEESAGYKTAKVGDESSTSRHDGPDKHPGAHVDARLDAGDEHVTGNLHEDIADEETESRSVTLFPRQILGREGIMNAHGDGCVKVAAGETEIFFQVVKTGLGDGVSVDIVEEVHDT
jgi:hypothetical protein